MERVLPPRCCRKCGQVKPPEAFETSRKRSCRECRAFTPCSICGEPSHPEFSTCGAPACLHEANVRSGRKAGQVAYRNWLDKHGGRHARVCPSCGKHKPLTDEHWRVSLRNPDGTVKRWSPYCTLCCRAYYRMVYAMNPAWRARASANSERVRSELQKRLDADPELAAKYRARRREVSRRYYARKREPATNPRTQDGTYLPTAPFIAWIKRTQPKYETREDFCAAAGLSENNLRRIVSGKQTHVQLDTVDAALVREGSADLRDVYPDLYELEVAA